MPHNIQDLLSSAYSAIRASETNRILKPLTLDHLIQEQIDSIKGGASRTLLSSAGTEMNSNRTCKLDTLDDIQAAIDAIVDAVQRAGSDPQKLRDLGFDDGSSGV